MKSSAIISDCGQYRYELRRIWNPSKPLALFICHNPSKADHTTDDKTSNRCIDYAKIGATEDYSWATSSHFDPQIERHLGTYLTQLVRRMTIIFAA